MKAVARSFMWWPGLDGEIERVVKSCPVCQNVRSLPPKMPLHPWKWPTRPFQRVHVDFCQKGKDYFLVVIDSHSKWIDVNHLTSTTTERTIDELRLKFETGATRNRTHVNEAQTCQFLDQVPFHTP